MRVPLSWLREYVDLPDTAAARDVADALVQVGLEVEAIHAAGGDVSGPLLVGRVLSYEDETHKNGKIIRWCSVDVGEEEPRGIVCGARNFAVGDPVIVALPGATLAGGLPITARKTYGHVSDGMICSPRELGLGDDHSGILVLDADEAKPGEDAHTLLRLRDDVLDIAVTPDRGYCLSIRGVAREAAIAYGVEFHDPADAEQPELNGGWPVRLDDPFGCDRFVALTVTGFDPVAASPRWLQRRVQLGGMRPISLAVDVTNYVMLELGQPIHAYDQAALSGPIVVRRARAGERLQTLDGSIRELDPDDLLITDDSGPIGLAGVMGGATTEISASTTDLVIEAAHFDPATIARTARRHKLPSEASRRFERGVDRELPPVAALRVAKLLVELGGGSVGWATQAWTGPTSRTVRMQWELPTRVAGRMLGRAVVTQRLQQIGCTLRQLEQRSGGTDAVEVEIPSWRPDLTDPNDLAEEVIRLEGYDTIPSVLPVAPAGRGLTESQRLRRRVGRELAGAGYVEVLSYPFMSAATLDAMGVPEDDPRRVAVRLANPLSDEEPLLRTTLLPGLLTALRRNVGRGQTDLVLFESGLVFRPDPVRQPAAPRLRVDRRPTEDELAQLDAAVPRQPRHVAVALGGNWQPNGWWGPPRPVCWADAVEAARTVARTARVELAVRAAEHAPWHPGRCAVLLVGGRLVGHAGELHPRVVEALDLPPRTCAMELDLDALGVSEEPVRAPRLSTYPVATQDVALIVDQDVPAADVEAALRDGAGELLESVRLFDVFTGPQIGAGKKSLAYALRFRAPDRTLTVEETTAARDNAVAMAAARTGAGLRGS
jgi:phenylalanyl-tRNA synthetase beta chain